MSTNPLYLRFPFNLTGKVHPEADQAIRYAYNGLLDVNEAIKALNTKVTGVIKTTTTVVNAAASGGGGGGGGSSNTIGSVNDQTAATDYTVQQSDYGALILLSPSAPFPLTLNGSVTTPYYCAVANYGSATATATPDSGNVNNVASWPVYPNQATFFYFDGVNWWATPLVPQTTPAVAHQWIDSYDAATGILHQSQPSAADLADSTVGSGAVVLDSGATLINVTLTGINRIIALGVYVDNAAAIAGGLVAGDLYRTSADPSVVCVVF